jgi:hydrogenase expression/formation protein HypD
MSEGSPLASYRDPALLARLAGRLSTLEPGRELVFMHVCGTHENAIAKNGLRGLLPPWLRVIAGPGCPVCVCPPADIDLAARLSLDHGAIVATYGDMMHVPGRLSLAEARARGGDVRVVYGAADAVRIAAENPDRATVLLAVGFETTACTTAAAVAADPPPGFSLLLSHRLIPPALRALLALEIRTDGFLLPGHVLTVTGSQPYEPIAAESGLPMVVAGFEPVDILLGLLRLVEQALGEPRARGRVVNSYPRAVRREGNARAVAAMEQVFEPADARWRGLGSIPASGLRLRPAYRGRDALERFPLTPDPDLPESLPGCLCAQVMVGLKEPEECGLFGAGCDPDAPRGPCMVSFEGTCRNRYLYQEQEG